MFLKKFPWLISRKKTIIAYIFEVISFLVIYFVIYKLRFGILPIFSLYQILLLQIWIFISYLSGRYSIELNAEKNLIIYLVKTLVVLFSTISLFLTIVWILGIQDFLFLFRSFLIPFMFFFAILSGFNQIFVSFIIRLYKKPRNKFLFLGSSKVLELIKKEVGISNFYLDLKLVSSFEDISENDLRETCGIIIEDEKNFKEFFRIKKNHIKNDDYLVLNIFKWCEIYLQRFPTNLITFSNVMTSDFKVKNSSIHQRIKRISDFIVSLFLIFLSAPIVAILCIFIRFEDKGPILYKQLRSGFRGKVFKIYKLRTMKVNSEKSGPQWSSSKDSRITKIGKFMRVTRLDELPQLFTVLNGEMSLIGPRPERPEFDIDLKKKIIFYEKRYDLKPGLSGWAQVNYPYGASTFDSANKLSYDLFYIKNASIWLDLLIFFKTIKLVLNAKGSKPLEQKL